MNQKITRIHSSPRKEVSDMMVNKFESNSVKLTISANGAIRDYQNIPKIKGYESVTSIDYDYNTLINEARIEIVSDSKIEDISNLINFVINY